MLASVSAHGLSRVAVIGALVASGGAAYAQSNARPPQSLPEPSDASPPPARSAPQTTPSAPVEAPRSDAPQLVLPAAPSGGKCVAHDDCTGDLLCIDYRCSVPPRVPPRRGPAYLTPGAEAGPAGAHENREKMPRVIIGVERLFGLAAWTRSNTYNGANDGSSSGVSASGLIGAVSPDAVPALAYQIPRAAVDYVFPFRLTVGVGGGIFFGRSSAKTASGNTSDGPGLSLWVVAPHVGYILPLGTHFALWPRAGASVYGFAQSSTSSKGSTSLLGMAVDVEPTFVFRPSKYTGITASVLADVGLWGKQRTTSSNSNVSETVTASSFGTSFGVYGAF